MELQPMEDYSISHKAEPNVYFRNSFYSFVSVTNRAVTVLACTSDATDQNESNIPFRCYEIMLCDIPCAVT